jgi:hypothetical protein
VRRVRHALSGGRSVSVVMGKLAGAAAATTSLTWPLTPAVARPWRSPWSSCVDPERVATALAPLLADRANQGGQIPCRSTGPRVTRRVAPADPAAVPNEGGLAAGQPGRRSRVSSSTWPSLTWPGGNTGTSSRPYGTPGRGAPPRYDVASGRPTIVREGQADRVPVECTSRSVSPAAADGGRVPPSASPLNGRSIRRAWPGRQPAPPATDLPLTPLAASSSAVVGPVPTISTGHTPSTWPASTGARGLSELLQRWESGSEIAPVLQDHPGDAAAKYPEPAQAATSGRDLVGRWTPAGPGTARSRDAVSWDPVVDPLPGPWADHLLDDVVETALDLLLDREAARHGFDGGAP